MVIGTYPDTIKSNPGGTEEGVGSANLQSITKDIGPNRTCNITNFLYNLIY